MFLMNDAVISLDASSLLLPVELQRFDSVSLPFVVQLGQELYSEYPLLQHAEPEKAKRLAMLLLAKNPDINAALFVAPAQGCPPAQVATRFCQIGVDTMGVLYAKQEEGRLDTVATDREVWRRLAA